MNFKDIALKERRIVSGHRMCPGCAVMPIVRIILAATDKDVVAACATGCLEVATTIYPYSSWNIPFIHNAFENAAATISGIERAYKALKKKGKIKKEIKFIAFGGDGGSYDIGLQALSGAAERGHDFVYVCYNNEGYMNTGNQRSSATPYGAHTTTSPAGEIKKGKENFRKDLTEIMVAHGIPYAAQASLSHPFDLFMKAQKAFDAKGPAFINVIAPCLQWGIKQDEAIEIADKAVKSCFWPLYEVENGKYKINFKPDEKMPILDFIKSQLRFKHLLEDKEAIEKIQKHIDEKWKHLIELEKIND
jgi:pyruvate ferredoxin oxidoreductase beta subunit